MTDKMRSARAVVFDAYGTLFDFGSPAQRLSDVLGDRWRTLADLWRAKQLQYTWLRSLQGRHADFWQVTGEALEFALSSLGVDDAGVRQRLLELYERLDAHPDARDALARLRGGGLRLAILSNGSPRMLEAAARSAGIAEFLDLVLSVEEVGIYKPHPSVYQLAVDRLGLPADGIAFVSANGWDAYSAKAFGLSVAWCNRSGQPAERIPSPPDAEIRSLSELPPLLGR
ncbi:MAG TPA: haloacid dehalogenase type II [Anaeromyxobacteraceae bacterium]|nr:haloacid dehalogenase type II [Anaeromyxobacteraceae bacterium]